MAKGVIVLICPIYSINGVGDEKHKCEYEGEFDEDEVEGEAIAQKLKSF